MTRQFEARDPDFATRIHRIFDSQPAMHLIGARLLRVEPGLVEIELPYRADLCQQNGYIHGGITSTIADSAGGYAGFSLMAADADVLTVELKLSLLAPARGDRLVATGRVLKPGRTLFFCSLEVTAHAGDAATVCAHGLQTLIAVGPR